MGKAAPASPKNRWKSTYEHRTLPSPWVVLPGAKSNGHIWVWGELEEMTVLAGTLLPRPESGLMSQKGSDPRRWHLQCLSCWLMASEEPHENGHLWPCTAQITSSLKGYFPFLFCPHGNNSTFILGWVKFSRKTWNKWGVIHAASQQTNSFRQSKLWNENKMWLFHSIMAKIYQNKTQRCSLLFSL